jgi:AGCS family alanine or glycine:cation symporter
MAFFESIAEHLYNWVWSPPLLIVILIVGVYLTFQTRGVQFRDFWYAHKLAFTRHDDQSAGDISHFEAFMTALSGTIGIGSITGVATALSFGGVGALFWMWVVTLIGMATKFGEAILAIKLRVKDENGKMCGGPMYYIEKGMKWKGFARFFAVFGVLACITSGNMLQSNSVMAAVHEGFGVSPLWVGLALMFLVGAALIKGIKSIGKINSFLVPAMSLFYIGAGCVVLALRFEQIPMAFGLIFKSAFTGQAAVGGALGATVMMAIQFGGSRSVVSREAGLGTSPVIAAAAKTDRPGRQALVSMCTVFITVGIVCTITGLVLIVSGVLNNLDPTLIGSPLVLRGFNAVLPYGGTIVTIALITFAYSTILGWAYCGEKYVEYLFGVRATLPYRILFTLLVFPGVFIGVDLIWDISSAMNGLMTFPNLIALFALGGLIKKETLLFDKAYKLENK